MHEQIGSTEDARGLAEGKSSVSLSEHIEEEAFSMNSIVFGRLS